MGAWGTGPFDNDDGMDFFLDLEDASAEKITHRVREVLTVAVGDDSYLDEHVAGETLAAAAVVAHWRRSGSGAADGEIAASVAGNPRVAEWLAKHPPVLTAADADLALRALDRVSGDRCEWSALWTHAGRGEEARAVVQRLREVIAAPV